MNKNDFKKAGFTVVDAENNENKLLSFLKENYPSIIKDNEINLQELKAVLGLPVDEKVNGYGLNFVGRNFARAKYKKDTEKELRLNKKLSKNIDTTQNLVLKGDNIDSLKILKNKYSSSIKMIYIDPPYNTKSDEFVYPDRFDKEETEVLGFTNLSEEDFARMDFSFKSKKSHNGWLSFMYPRLLLARDLLSNDGVIFISIDDNEQANLKLLCDDVFGEDNFVAEFVWTGKSGSEDDSHIRNNKEYILCYAKNIDNFNVGLDEKKDEKFIFFDPNKNDYYKRQLLRKWGANSRREDRPNLYYPIKDDNGNDFYPTLPNGEDGCWRWSKEKMEKAVAEGRIEFATNGKREAYEKIYKSDLKKKQKKFKSLLSDLGSSAVGTNEIKQYFEDKKIFNNPKPTILIKQLLNIANTHNDIILDFFAGSGTTGDAVMQLNAEDGGNRKFILCQIDEPIDPKKNKTAYDFCIENNLPPVISSITVERLNRAGEKIKQEIEEENSKNGMFEEHKKQTPDIGYKVFDSVDAPKLEVDDNGQISINFNDNDTISRIYNMIFKVGIDDPTQVPKEIKKDSIYQAGDNFYVTNSKQITAEDFAEIIKKGKVFIDGWTADINGTLLNYKEDVKIVF